MLVSCTQRHSVLLRMIISLPNAGSSFYNLPHKLVEIEYIPVTVSTRCIGPPLFYVLINCFVPTPRLRTLLSYYEWLAFAYADFLFTFNCYLCFVSHVILDITLKCRIRIFISNLSAPLQSNNPYLQIILCDLVITFLYFCNLPVYAN